MNSINLTIKDKTATLLMLGDGKFNAALLADFNSAMDQVEQHPDKPVLIITGEAKSFSQGYDLDFLGTLGDNYSDFTDQSMQLISRLLQYPVPTMAMINGHAFGLGAMLAVACDFRCMREDRGYFCLPEIDLQMSLLPGMNALLKHKLPEPAYREALLTGKRYGGAEAAARGLVDFSADNTELAALAQQAIAVLADKDRATYGVLKTGLYAEIIEVIRNQH